MHVLRPLPQLDVELAADIRAFMGRFVAWPSEAHEVMLAFWLLHTWTIEAAHVTPYIYVTSDGPGCGKTRGVEVLSMLARNPIRADDMTAPCMFKVIARLQPTLLIDEVDCIFAGSRNDPKKMMLNTGYKLGGMAYREQAREVIGFTTYCAKVLAGIDNGFMPATIRDRCIPVKMTQRPKGHPLERFTEHAVRHSTEREALIDRIMAFKEAWFADITAMDPLPMAGLSDRQDEISHPLLAIACVFGMEDELREALQSIFATVGQTASPRQVILGRIRDAFGEQPKIFTEDLCALLGPAFNGRQLAIWLEPLGVRPKDVRIGEVVLKGYSRDQFDQAFRTYLGEPGPDLHAVPAEESEAA